MDMVFEVAPGDELAIDFGGALRLTLDADGIRLERRSLACDDALYRYWRGEVRALRILCDSSSIEIFINGGEGVMSSRYFPQYPGQMIFSGATPAAFCYWPLRPCMVESAF
jgi:beta-fructofuranosidase